MNLKSVHSSKTKGRFNLLSSEEQWSLRLVIQEEVEGQIIHRGISALFSEDNEPCFDNSCAPVEVLEAIRENWKGFMFRSDQAKDDEKAAWIEENLEEVTHTWAKRRINNLESRIEDLQEEVETLQEYL